MNQKEEKKEQLQDHSETLFAYYVDNEQTTTIPSKESGYVLSEESNCTNGVSISWDTNNWSAIVDFQNYKQEGKNRTSCNLYFVSTKNMMVPMESDIEFDSYNSVHVLVNLTYSQNQKYLWKMNKIVFQKELNPIANAAEIVDFSANKDGSVLGYYVENEDSKYDLYIQADGKIKMNPIGKYYFVYVNALGSNVYAGNNPVFEGTENIDTSLVTDMSHMFEGCPLNNLDLSFLNTKNVKNMSSMFSDMINIENLDLSNFDTSKVTDMSYMFSDMKSLKNINLTSLNTSNVTNMSNMFLGMKSLTSLDISHFDTSNVTNMSWMFHENSLSDLDLSHFNTTKVTSMWHMFTNMKNLTSLDISNFDTKNVTNMSYMFDGLSSLESLDIGHFDTSKVVNMMWMFSGMNNLVELNISGFDTSNVTNMNGMFYHNSKLTNITYGDSFIHKEDATIDSMYSNCPANKPTHQSWNDVTW